MAQHPSGKPRIPNSTLSLEIDLEPEKSAPASAVASPSKPAYVEDERTDPGIRPAPRPRSAAGDGPTTRTVTALRSRAPAAAAPAPAPAAAAPPARPATAATSSSPPAVAAASGAPATATPPPAPPAASGPAAAAAAAATPPAANPGAPARRAVRMPELGQLDALMKDPTISEIMVNDIRNVMVEKNGQLVYAGFAVTSIDELNRIARNILDVTGRLLTPDSPYVDTMMPDGSRVNIVGPPLTLNGPCITIRKFPERSLALEDLVNAAALDRHAAHFLSSCVFARMNILISGGTGSGKTTLLNALLGFVPRGERIIMIEDTPELALPHPNSVRMQTKPQTPASAAIGARELVANALRMRPDRIVVGECRRAEAFDMLQAMNTGHEGSMTTIHANSSRDALSRLETLCLLAGMDMPLLAIRKQIVGAIDLIVQIRRFRDGKRKIVAVSEVTGMEGDTVTLQEIFAFKPQQGIARPCGLVPTFVERLRDFGIELPPNYFA